MTTIPEEFDYVQRSTKVYLCTRTIGSDSNGERKQTTDHGSVVNMFLHWALLFEFGDGDYRCVEALNEDDKLIPYYHKERLDGYTRATCMGIKTLSPFQVHGLIRNNPYNYKYYNFMLGMTCQHWILSCLGELGFDCSGLYTGTFGAWVSITTGGVIIGPILTGTAVAIGVISSYLFRR